MCEARGDDETLTSRHSYFLNLLSKLRRVLLTVTFLVMPFVPLRIFPCWQRFVPVPAFSFVRSTLCP